MFLWISDGHLHAMGAPSPVKRGWFNVSENTSSGGGLSIVPAIREVLKAEVDSVSVSLMTYRIYKATSPSEKVYVGLTCRTLAARKEDHFEKARRGGTGIRRLHFWNALLKYGDLMQWEILEDGISGLEAANSREQYYIQAYNSNDPAQGYNLTAGGDGTAGHQHTEVSKLRISAAKRGKPCNRTPAGEARRQKAISKRVFRSDGAVFSSITLAGAAHGLSPAQMEYIIQNNRLFADFLFGFTPTFISDECRPWNLRGKPVFRSDGVVYPSQTAAAQALGLTQSDIQYSIRSGKPRMGFTFSQHQPSTEAR